MVGGERKPADEAAQRGARPCLIQEPRLLPLGAIYLWNFVEFNPARGTFVMHQFSHWIA